MGVWGLLCCWRHWPARAQAQGVELATLELHRQEGDLSLEFDAPITLPRTVEDALQRGVPMYFVVEATLFRYRWYWRDERVARVQRSWRVSYQPLTGELAGRLGGLDQSYATLAEALAVMSRSPRLADGRAAQIEAGQRYYVEFSYRLDTTQLPSPMQIGLGAGRLGRSASTRTAARRRTRPSRSARR